MKKFLLPIISCILLLSVLALYKYSNPTHLIIPDTTMTCLPPTPTNFTYLSKQDYDKANSLSKFITTNTSYTKDMTTFTAATNLSVTNKETLSKLVSGTIVDVSKNKKDIVKIAFYYEKINKALKSRMKDKSYKKNCTVPYEDLRYVRVLYYGFDKNTHIGELVVNKQIAKDITAIFKDLYLADYPIEKMVLIDDYNADDEASMTDNNTSSFNFRAMIGSKNLSKHALGLAIDINPLYNPYVKKSGSKITVSPESGYKYKDRTLDITYFIKKNDACYNAFIQRGFIWGGSWKTIKDYQHFEKSIK